MWRCLAILLTAVFGWMLVVPAFAASAESNVPICCRKGGKHECTMHTAAAPNVIVALSSKCPYCPQRTTAAQWGSFKPSNGQAIFAGWIRHPAITSETEAGFRVSFHRSRLKRGPPSLLLS